MIKKGSYEKVKEMMDSEDGLKTTRNYDWCTHLEAFYNEEQSTYFIVEYWESFEKYQTYLDWRLNDDPITLEDLSKKYKISRERVRQIENKAFEKLQKHMLLLAKSKNLLPAN